MDRMSYEHFIRNAFKYALKREVGRAGDPASLGDADNFHDSNLSSVKFALGYSMHIYITDIINNCHTTESEDTRLETYSDRLITCQDINAISILMDDFIQNVFERYYTQLAGEIKLNCP